MHTQTYGAVKRREEDVEFAESEIEERRTGCLGAGGERREDGERPKKGELA